MKQRLAIAAALLGKPEVLILDEPTNGLDPQGIAEIRTLIQEIAANGTTVILASHLLDEVQKVCSHVAVLKTGRLLYAGSVAGVMSSAQTIALSAGDLNALESILLGFPGNGKVSREGKLVIFDHPDFKDGAKTNRLLHEKGISVSHLAVRSSSLEKEFLALLSSGK